MPEQSVIDKESGRKRPLITIGDIFTFLSTVPRSTPIHCAPSLLNIDEPEETQEFIDSDNQRPCVAIKWDETSVTFGFVK